MRQTEVNRLASVRRLAQGVVSNPPIRILMHALATRILVALLVLSQTWTGALRGLELCIPVGFCEGCGLGLAAHDQAHNHRHAAQDRRHHSHTPHAAEAGCAHHDAHARRHAHTHEGSPGLEPACVCHIHVATPDDDSHRGVPPCAKFVALPLAHSAVDCWILAAWDRLASSPQRFGGDDPPDSGAPPLFEQVVIEATVLLV